MHAVSRTVSKHPLGDKTTEVEITNGQSTIQPVEPPWLGKNLLWLRILELAFLGSPWSHITVFRNNLYDRTHISLWSLCTIFVAWVNFGGNCSAGTSQGTPKKFKAGML